MAPSRSNWLLLPVGFAIIYAVITWAYWVPLDRPRIATQSGGTSFIPYWEGEVIGFVAIRILSALVLSLVCCVFPPPGRWLRIFSIGAVTGLVASVIDRFCWNWIQNHVGYLVALFGIPMLSGGILVLLFRFIEGQQAGGQLEQA